MVRFFAVAKIAVANFRSAVNTLSAVNVDTNLNTEAGI